MASQSKRNNFIAQLMDWIADLLEIQGANPFRVRAYRSAGRVIEGLDEPIAEIVADPDRDLMDIKGIGKDLAGKITELVETDRIEFLDQLKAEIPDGVLLMLRVPGLGPKKVGALFRELGVTDMDQLLEACESGRVAELKGFGAKTVASIQRGIELAEQLDTRMLWADADLIATHLIAGLKQRCPAIRRIEAAGSYRRCRETVGDLDILVDSDDPAQVMDQLINLSETDEILVRGDTKMSIRLPLNSFQVDLRVVPTESYGAALQYFTGSQSHNVELRRRAKRCGLKVNEYGVFRDDEQLAGAEERDVYEQLELPWIVPELRENRHELEWAESDELPDLITRADIRGDLHMHTVWSDGQQTIEEMADAAHRLGYEYIAITDHSKRTAIAGGLQRDELLRQWEAIDRLNENGTPVRLLKGVECDILEQGGMDFDDELLAQADWVIASVHFGREQSGEELTRRVLDAMQNPYVRVLAHPTGRLLGQRPPFPLDIEAVIEAAQKYGKSMELNSSPDRLDLDDTHCAMARRLGVPIVISTDAHHRDSLENIRYGLNQARRAGLEPSNVLNTKPLDEFLAALVR